LSQAHSRGESSSLSVVSEDFLREYTFEEIKRSKVKVVNKSVIKWTPVVLGRLFPPNVAPQKFEYTSGRVLNSAEIPRVVENLQGGLILRLPLERVADAVSKVIMSSALRSDDNLC
jgi:hypothetical protein